MSGEQAPALQEFRVEVRANGIAHLIFDMPDRSTNVFSRAAISDFERFVAWLGAAPDIRGAVIRSGKAVFSAGGDLTELATAYDAITAAPREERSALAFDTFFLLSRTLRALETCGKPVAAAVAGLALGGGYELALACHWRVLAGSGKVELGLPESLVGLLPGGGGTQRLPRLIGIERALPILLYGKRLSPEDALSCGGADEVVPAGEEVPAAERWVLSRPEPRQPWDRPGWRAPGKVHATVEEARRRVLEKTFGLYPATLAILDCVERGLEAAFDEAIVIEMEIFAELIQRVETRNMIQTLFIGKLDLERRRRAGQLSARFDDIASAAVAALRAEIAEAGRAGTPSAEIEEALTAAGYSDKARQLSAAPTVAFPSASRFSGPGLETAGLWFERLEGDPRHKLMQRLVIAPLRALSSRFDDLDDADRRIADYVVSDATGFPAYLGGPFALLSYLGGDRLAAIDAHIRKR
jgi:3-hydroxyacyl-CoA dehydrogenase/enoyl-CoA hydratase/3-hydroxybutyryl-CoA epimerase